MGIYSRDYVRESNSRAGGFGDDTPACKWLIIVTVVVFLLELVVTHPYVTEDGVKIPEMRESYLDDWFKLGIDKIRQGQVWRLVTCAFLHSRYDIWHLIFNMLGLWWFGSEMERLYGSREFTYFYLAAAAVASLGFVFWQLATGDGGYAIGASGAVLAAMMLYATHYPREKIGLFYGLIFIEVRWVVALYAVLDLIPVLRSLQGEQIGGGVGHAAHLLGLLFGWMYRHYQWHLSSLIDVSFLKSLPRRWRRSQTKKSLRVFDPEPEQQPEGDLEGELDRILAKIHAEGSSSLTEREQSVLTRASQQYKNRK